MRDLVRQSVEAFFLPKPAGRQRCIYRLLKQLRGIEQAAVTEQRFAAGLIVVAARHLDQSTASVELAVAVCLRRVTQALRQATGVVPGQVIGIAKLSHVLQLA